jgi:hypothetical protein
MIKRKPFIYGVGYLILGLKISLMGGGSSG